MGNGDVGSRLCCHVGKLYSEIRNVELSGTGAAVLGSEFISYIGEVTGTVEGLKKMHRGIRRDTSGKYYRQIYDGKSIKYP